MKRTMLSQPGAMAVSAALLGMLAGCGSGSAVGHTSTGASSTPSLHQVSLEIPNTGATFTPFFLARDLGIFKKYGLSVKIINMSPPLAVSGITSKKLDFMSAIGSADHAAEEGEPMRVVDVAANHIDFVILGAKNIHSVSQLRGKIFVGYSATNTVNQVGEEILASYGLKPGSYQIDNVQGGDAARAALIEAGKAAATPMEYSAAIPLEKEGFPILANADKISLPFTGLATSTAMIQSEPGVVKAMVAATVEATRITRTDEAKTVPVMMKDFHLSKSVAQTLWKDMDNEWGQGGKPTSQALHNQMVADQKFLKLKTLPSPTPTFDWAFLPSSSS